MTEVTSENLGDAFKEASGDLVGLGVFVEHRSQEGPRRDLDDRDSGARPSRFWSVQAGIAMKARHLLEMIAQSPALRGTVEECESYLTWVQYLTQSSTAEVTGLFVMDPAGKGICGTYPNGRSVDVSDRPHYRC